MYLRLYSLLVSLKKIKLGLPFLFSPLFGKGPILHDLGRVLPRKARDKHTYIVGASGSGKSELLKALLIETKAQKSGFWPYRLSGGTSKNRTVIIIDPHGDLVHEISKLRLFFNDCITQKSNFYVIDPFFDSTLTSMPILNPFDLGGKSLTQYELDAYGEAIVDVFVQMLQGNGLTLQMKSLLVPCVDVLLKRPGSTLKDLKRFMVEEENQELLELGCNSTNEEHKNFFKNSFNQKNYQPTKDSLRAKCQALLNNSTFAHVIAGGKSTISIDDALNSGSTILVSCSKGRLGAMTSNALGRFIIAMVSGSIIRRTSNNKPRKPVDLIVDECQNFVGDNITFILNELRKYGLHLTLCQQYVGQSMTPEITKSVLSNTTIKIMGASDHGSLQPISNATGIGKQELQNIRGTGRFMVFNKDINSSVSICLPGDFVNNKDRGSVYCSEEDWKMLKAHIVQQQFAPTSVQETISSEHLERAEIAEVILETKAISPKFKNPFSNLPL